MSVISAGTTSTTAFKVTGDTTGTLQLQTGAVPTTAINISASQVVTFPATTTLDFTGSLLLGDGSASAPTLAHSGDTNTGIYFPGADQIAITTAGSQKLFVGTSFVVNEGGLDFDTRIEGDTDANLVFVDASADAVGIGTSSPGGKFNIVKAKSGTGAESYDMLRLNLTGTAAIGDSSDIVWYSGSTKVASINGILGADNVLYGTLAFSTRSYNTDTLVEAVRINNRSNVGIGTTNPASRLDVTGAFGTGTTAFTIYNSSGASASNIARIDFRVNNTFNGNEQVAAIWGINPNAGANNGGALVFATSDNGTATTPSERARITSGGDLLVGTTSTYGKVSVVANSNGVNDVWIRNDSAGSSSQCGLVLNASGNSWRMGMGSTANNSNNLTWVLDTSAPSEKMRLTTGGDLLVGTTTTSGKLTVNGYVSSLGTYTRPGSGGARGDNVYNFFWNGNVQVWIDATNVGNITLSSDYRIKKNVVTQTENALARIAKLRPIVYEYTDYGTLFKSDGVRREGFVAHEVQEVIPSGAEGYKDEENRIQNLRADAILAVVVKAIQELSAKVAALESK